MSGYLLGEKLPKLTKFGHKIAIFAQIWPKRETFRPAE